MPTDLVEFMPEQKVGLFEVGECTGKTFPAGWTRSAGGHVIGTVLTRRGTTINKYSLVKINCNARLSSENYCTTLRRQYTAIVKQLKSLLGAKGAHIKY